MSYEDEDEYGNSFKLYDDGDDEEFADPIDDYDLEDENPEKDG